MKSSDWISTKDRLPEINNDIDKFTHCSDEVLFCLNGNEVITGKLFKIDFNCVTYWVSGNYQYPSGLVTHWQEIVLP